MAVPPFARQPPETVRVFEASRQSISLTILAKGMPHEKTITKSR
jgi:hypothetical protein